MRIIIKENGTEVIMKKKKTTCTLDDYLKATRKGSREAEQQTLGPGFHSRTRVHTSKKVYTRKQKHHSPYTDQ